MVLRQIRRDAPQPERTARLSRACSALFLSLFLTLFILLPIIPFFRLLSVSLMRVAKLLCGESQHFSLSTCQYLCQHVSFFLPICIPILCVCHLPMGQSAQPLREPIPLSLLYHTKISVFSLSMALVCLNSPLTLYS